MERAYGPAVWYFQILEGVVLVVQMAEQLRKVA